MAVDSGVGISGTVPGASGSGIDPVINNSGAVAGGYEESGVVLVSVGTWPVPTRTGRTIGVGPFGPVVRAFKETDAVDLALPENLTTVRIFLRDCGIDPIEMPRGRMEFVFWFTEYIRPRPRTVLCGNCQDSLSETCFRGYDNNDPARLAVTMDVEGKGTPVGGEAIAPTDGGVEGEVAADAAF